MPPDTRFLPRLIGPDQRGPAWRLAMLMTASALTESLGVMLLVPLLALVQPGGGGRIGTWFDAWGIAPSLNLALVIFVVLIAARAVINLLRSRAALRLELGVVDRLRRRVWHALHHADWRLLAAMRRSDNTSILVTEIDRAGFGVNQAIQGLATCITLAALGLAGLIVAPLVTLGGIVGGALVLLAYRRLRRRAAQLGDRLSAAYAGIQGNLSDSLAALRLVKSMGGEDYAQRKAFSAFDRLSATRIAYQRDTSLGQMALQAGGAAVLAVLVWLAVNRLNLAAATIVPLVAVFARSLPLLGALQESWQNFAHARPAIAATFALIDRAEASHEVPGPRGDAPALDQALRAEDVTVQFAGSDRPALAGVSFTLPARSIVALTGASGAGKSTLADVLGGLLAPDGGRILIDGVALDPGSRRAWRRRVAHVHQDAVLMAETLRDNLAWGRDFSDAALDAALRAAAADFALDLPAGLDTRLGDGGRVLSGGERQRVALARALLDTPALLILDEATSALDAESEARIAAAITSLKAQMTIVVIGHRGALLGLADHHIVLEDGRLVTPAPS